MRILLSLLSLVFVMSSAFGQATNERYSKESIEKAKNAGEIIVFEKEVIDLGKIEKGSMPELTFRFLNISDENIEYSFFDVCSCTLLTYDKDAIIKPGEEGEFHVKFDSDEKDVEEPIDINFELKNIDKRNGYPFFYSIEYIYQFL